MRQRVISSVAVVVVGVVPIVAGGPVFAALMAALGLLGYAEYVRLTNTRSTAINLKGWYVRDKAGYTYKFTSDYRVAAGNTSLRWGCGWGPTRAGAVPACDRAQPLATGRPVRSAAPAAAAPTRPG